MAIIREGLRVSQISSRRYCDYLGMHSFPDFMFENQYSEKEKILLFNHWVKQIELYEKPDVILLGVPGGIIPYNDTFVNYFGITPYEVLQAVRPDSLILGLPYKEYTSEFFEEMNRLTTYHFGVSVDSFTISNDLFDLNSSMERQAPCYITVQPNKVDELLQKIGDTQYKVFNVCSGIQKQKMAQLILDNLEAYPDLQTL